MRASRGNLPQVTANGETWDAMPTVSGAIRPRWSFQAWIAVKMATAARSGRISRSMMANLIPHRERHAGDRIPKMDQRGRK
jgi:hypothetical protein